MTATSPTVKMAACLHQDGDSSDSDKPGPSSHSQTSRQAAGGTQGGVSTSSATSADIKLQGDKVTPYFHCVVVGDDWQGEGGKALFDGEIGSEILYVSCVGLSSVS